MMARRYKLFLFLSLVVLIVAVAVMAPWRRSAWALRMTTEQGSCSVAFTRLSFGILPSFYG